jgi:uncharacterized protein with GYD domain
MATFVLLSTLTDEGAKTITERPVRIKEVDDEILKQGVTVVTQWAVLGPYDFVTIVEAPDDLVISKVSALLSSRGTVRIMTLPAIPVDEFIAGLAKE